MEKLIELLNEYEKKRIEKINSEGKLMVKLSFRPYTEDSLTNKAYRSCWLEICSKYYGFIRWLVENDKIDIDKMEEKSEYTFIKNGGGEHIIEDVLMLLTIQDEPINFLISILK